METRERSVDDGHDNSPVKKKAKTFAVARKDAYYHAERRVEIKTKKNDTITKRSQLSAAPVTTRTTLGSGCKGEEKKKLNKKFLRPSANTRRPVCGVKYYLSVVFPGGGGGYTQAASGTIRARAARGAPAPEDGTRRACSIEGYDPGIRAQRTAITILLLLVSVRSTLEERCIGNNNCLFFLSS